MNNHNLLYGLHINQDSVNASKEYAFYITKPFRHYNIHAGDVIYCKTQAIRFSLPVLVTRTERIEENKKQYAPIMRFDEKNRTDIAGAMTYMKEKFKRK